jgi:hypothetical protein
MLIQTLVRKYENKKNYWTRKMLRGREEVKKEIIDLRGCIDDYQDLYDRKITNGDYTTDQLFSICRHHVNYIAEKLDFEKDIHWTTKLKHRHAIKLKEEA